MFIKSFNRQQIDKNGNLLSDANLLYYENFFLAWLL
jgi:hypothetical protein